MLARRAHDVAHAIGVALSDPLSLPGEPRATNPPDGQRAGADEDPPWLPFGLAGGHAGIAVLAASLADAFPEEPWDRVAHAHLTAATADASLLGQLGPSLHDGWGGLVFAADAMARGGRRYRSFLDAADARLAAGARRLAAAVAAREAPLPPPLVDVISGLAGLVAVLLRRRARPEPRGALGDVLGALVGLAAIEQGTPRVASPAEWGVRLVRDASGPILNLGLAHGLPGLVAALSLAWLEDVRVGGHDEAIDALAAWLVRERSDDPWGPVWPNAVALHSRGPMPAPARMAWCYGVPGCARALWLAGQALGRSDWKLLSLEAMRGALRRPPERRGLPSATFCHGRAGLLHIALRFAVDTEDPMLVALWQQALAELVADHDPDSRFGYRRIDTQGRPRDDPGLLDGAAGVALVLLAAARDAPPAWDRAFLLG